MSLWRPALALSAILRDADRVAPGRSHASDGTIGDATHSASVSDHNPDSNGIVHACDVTHDPVHGFDAWHWAQKVADRIKAGTETRVKYLVAFDGDKDVIYNASVAPWWRQNGARKAEHASHLHVSILYTGAAENDQSRFFGDGPVLPLPLPPNDKESETMYAQFRGETHRFWKNTGTGQVGHAWNSGDENLTSAEKFEPMDPGPSPLSVHVTPNETLCVGGLTRGGTHFIEYRFNVASTPKWVAEIWPKS